VITSGNNDTSKSTSWKVLETALSLLKEDGEWKNARNLQASTIYHEPLALVALQEIRSCTISSIVMIFYLNARYVAHKYSKSAGLHDIYRCVTIFFSVLLFVLQ